MGDYINKLQQYYYLNVKIKGSVTGHNTNSNNDIEETIREPDTVATVMISKVQRTKIKSVTMIYT